MEIQQYVYGRETSGGWGALYRSQDIARARGFEGILAGKIALDPRAPQSAVKFKYFHVEIGKKTRWILAYSVPGERDSGGRPGVFFNHCLIGEDLQNELDGLPVELWDWTGWIRRAQRDLRPPALTVPFRPAASRGLQGFLDDLRRHQADLAWIAPMIDAFLAYAASNAAGQTGRRRLQITGSDSAQVAAWIGVLSFCLPEKLVRDHLTFSTYEDEDDGDLWLVAGPAEAGGEGRSAIDLSRPCEEYRHSGPWGQFAVQCLRGEDGLSEAALELGRTYHDAVMGRVSDPMNECANFAYWATHDQAFTGLMQGDPRSILGTIRPARRQVRVRLLTLLQELVWPRRSEPRSDGRGAFDRPSSLWLEQAAELMGGSGENLGDLRRAYLTIVESYCRGADGLDSLRRLEEKYLDDGTKRRIFVLLAEVFPRAELGELFQALEICRDLKLEREAAATLAESETRRNLRRLSRQPGYATRLSQVSVVLQEALEKAVGTDDVPAAAPDTEDPEAGASLDVAPPVERRARVETLAPLSTEELTRFSPENLEDPHFLYRLAKARGISETSSDVKKQVLREEFWRLASSSFGPSERPTPKELFDPFFWTLWQARQGQDLLGQREAARLVEDVLARVGQLERHRSLVLRMLREAFESARQRRHPSEAWMRKLFELSWFEKLAYF